MNYNYFVARIVFVFSILVSTPSAFAQLQQFPAPNANSNTTSSQVKVNGTNSGSSIDLAALIQNKNSGDYVITSEHVSRVSGIHHIYLRQAINGMEVHGTESSVHFGPQGELMTVHNRFVDDINGTVRSSTATITAEEAITAVAGQMGYTLTGLQELERRGGIHQEVLYNRAGISGTEIPVKLVYYYREGIGTQIVWEFPVQELTSSDWWNFRVDATNGNIIDKDNWTVSCFSEEDHDTHSHSSENKTLIKDEFFYAVPTEEESSLMVGSYRVFAMPIETPNHGGRSLVSNPDDATASPFGWHDTNGVAGAEFTRTQGNNARAYDDDNSTNSPSGPNAYAEGGGSLIFDFTLNTTYSAGNQSEDAAVTNLFYWTNIIHDVLYHYGFDEPSGNFQENNYGNGGSGSDSVNSEAQDGSGTCNANFGTPSDGFNPRMQMFVCNDRDGDYDNAVIVHEYGHGISNRLTGGPGAVGCLNNNEQMGEGWSDIYGLLLTMEPDDEATDVRGIGTWLVGEDETGTGIRTFAYSTDFGVNSLTYDDINSEPIPHGVGATWCSMLWDMTWGLIDEHGFSTDFYTFTGNANVDAGNVQALALITEGMKLQPCSPGFVDGRDAILQADMNIYGGANQCIIWEAFANRGLGFSALQGSTNNENDGTPAFDLPPTIAGFENTVSQACLGGGTLTGLGGGFPTGGVYSGPGVTDDGNGTTYTFNPVTAGVGTHTITYTVNDFCNSGSSTNFDQTIDVQDTSLSLTCPGDIEVESDSSTVCQAEVVYTYPTPEGDLCNRTPNDLSQNTVTTIGAALDCTDTPSGHVRSFNLTTMGVVRDYTINGIDVAINTNSGVAPLIVNIYLDSQLGAAVTTFVAPISGAVAPYASATSLVPAGSNFTHTVPMNVFLPAGTTFHVEVISPSSRTSMVGYNSSGTPPANETTTGFINCVGGTYGTPAGFGFGHLAVIIEVDGEESNEYTTTQTAGLAPGSVFPAGTTTNTFMTSAQSGGSTSCSFDVTVIGKTTIYAGGVWSPIVPDVGSNAQFDENYNTVSGDISACSCDVESGATVTVNANGFLDINGRINVDGSLIVQHQGSVVQTDGDAPVVNNGTINVELTTPVLQTRDWMVMGSPMTAETRTGVYNTAFLVLEHTPATFIPHPLVPAGGTNFADDDNDFWTQFASGPINVGEGYIVRPQSSYTDPANVSYNFTHALGTLNNGDVSRNVLFNGLGTNPDGTPNVFSNPYASAIDADDFITNNALVNEVYFWEHLTPPSSSIPGGNTINFSMGDISMYNLGGGTAAANDPGTSTEPNGIISTGQGFGIKAFGAGTVTFTNSMRRTTGNTTLRRPQDGVDRVWLKVSHVDYGLKSNTLIGFNPNATAGLDAGYDSNRLATFIALYSHLEDGSEQLGIQTREALTPDLKIPMGFASQLEETSRFTISIAGLDGDTMGVSTIYLVDHHLNLIANLNEQDYTFVSGPGTFNGRFTLQFQYEVLSTNDNPLETIAIYPNPTNDILNIFSPIEVIERVEVFDIRGRMIHNARFNTQGVHQIDLSAMETAVYFVKLYSDSGSVTKRIIKE